MLTTIKRLLMASFMLGGLFLSEAAYAKTSAPEIPANLEWINSWPLSMQELKGKLVLIDIWDYTCVNCIRTLPYLKEWHKRYASYGLVIIGVHAPEFEFAKDLKNVKTAVDKFRITYPVVLDNNYKIWNAYANKYWPCKYLVDRDGYIIYSHSGEGGYHETEFLIQRILKEMNPKIKLPAVYDAPGPPESGGICYLVTPELYLGHLRGRMGNIEGYTPGATINYLDRRKYEDGFIFAHGPWVNLEESLRHARKDLKLEDYVAVKYHALSVNAVIKPAKEAPYKVYIQQDNKPVAPRDRGEDIKRDRKGRTYILINQARMYRIIRNRKFGTHVLKLYSESESCDIYSFTFGSCEIISLSGSR